MNDNGPASNRRGRVSAVQSAKLIVINGRACGFVPNHDAELVHPAAALNVPVDGREDEGVVAGIVHGAGAFVLCARARNYQPIVAAAMEVEVGDLELKLGFARGSNPRLGPEG